ncbi:hypothetical protein Acr_10g0008790 [Actinidia rufa]|uniref:Uncharacterized protein n=1 Tax=Actinidia rufa TaxID=165716 RepID=A0A7J0F9X4_9ERIC|nr:hypothetical protein Acr_10g0008790 [Actinidia rufa]
MVFAASSGSAPCSSGEWRVLIALPPLQIYLLVMPLIYLTFRHNVDNCNISWVPCFNINPQVLLPLAIGSPTAFHAKNSHPTWVLDL